MVACVNHLINLLIQFSIKIFNSLFCSFFTMFNFNPFDSDSFPQNDENISENTEDTQPFLLDEQGNPIPFQPLPNFINDSSEEEDPNIASDPNEQSIHMSDLKNIRIVLGLLTHYPGGVLSNHLKEKQGLIILPLSAVSMLRKPGGNHISNPPAIIYYPSEGPDSVPHMEQFNEALRLLYSIPQ